MWDCRKAQKKTQSKEKGQKGMHGRDAVILNKADFYKRGDTLIQT